MKVDERCQICGNEGESINNVIFQCPLARKVWTEAGIPLPENGFHESSIYQNLNYLLGIKKRRIGELENIRAWP